MANIDTKYEVWKNKLLDLGKRNRLLNYKDTARSNVKIESPGCSALWDMFVKDEMPIIFPFEKESEEDFESEYESNVETNKSTSYYKKRLETFAIRLRQQSKSKVSTFYIFPLAF